MMRAKRSFPVSLRRWTVGVAAFLLLPITLPAEEVDFSNHLPKETHFAFWVDDIERAREETGKNPFLSAMLGEDSPFGDDISGAPRVLSQLPVSAADPLAPFWNTLLPTAGVSLEQSIESATAVFDFEPGEIQDTFSGSFAIYSTLYDLFIQNDLPVVEWDVVLAANYEPEDKSKVESFLENALARVPDSARKEQVRYSGHDVYHIEYFLDEQSNLPGDAPLEEFSEELVQEIPVIVEYAYIDDVFLLAEGRGEPLRRAVRALVRDDDRFRLNSDKGFRAGRQKLEEAAGGYHIYFDLPHHVSEWKDWPSEASRANMAEALGLAESGPILARASAQPEEFKINAVITAPDKASGLFDLMGKLPENKLESLDLIPPDAETFGSVTIDMEEAFQILRAVFNSGKPAETSFLMLALRNIENLTQVSLEEDVLPYSRGEVVSYLRPGVATESGNGEEIAAGFVLPLSGTEAVDSLNRLARNLSSEQTMFLDIESTDFQGFTLWESRKGTYTPNSAPGLYFSATPKGFVLANSGAEVREVLRRVSGKTTNTVRGREKIRRFIEETPGENLRGLAIMPAETLVKDMERRGRFTDGYMKRQRGASRQKLKSAIGDAWWTLHAGHDWIHLTYCLESPEEGI